MKQDDTLSGPLVFTSRPGLSPAMTLAFLGSLGFFSAVGLFGLAQLMAPEELPAAPGLELGVEEGATGAPLLRSPDGRELVAAAGDEEEDAEEPLVTTSGSGGEERQGEAQRPARPSTGRGGIVERRAPAAGERGTTTRPTGQRLDRINNDPLQDIEFGSELDV